VLHARAFRRLAGKTQVFTNRYSDHFRSRLTHTMEVAQIARTIARTLGLNEDLTEALALVHDIGHPPFGHAGERALDEALREHGLRFDHNLHALRIVEHFEVRYAEFRGLNLTLAVREGIIKHSHDYSAAEYPELSQYFLDQFPPLEAQLIDLADEIAYTTADFDDGFESGILTLAPARAGVQLFERFYAPMLAKYPTAPEKLMEAVGGTPDLVLSDMAAPTTGHHRTDHLRTMHLCEVAAHFAVEVLGEGGHFLAKTFQGGTERDLLAMLKQHFRQVVHVKPASSRAESVEMFLLAKGFKGRKAEAEPEDA